MLLVLEIHSPVHFRGVLSAHISPVGLIFIDVEACTLDCQLSINNESEDGLLLPIYCDVSGDIVAKRKLGGEAPLLVSEAVAGAATILATTKHEESLAIDSVVEQASSRSHGILAKLLGKFSGALELPIFVKADDEALLEDSFLLDGECNEASWINLNEVLEIDLRESKGSRRHFTLSITDLEDSLLGAFTLTITPEANCNLLALTLKHAGQAWHLNLGQGEIGDDLAIPVVVHFLQLGRLLDADVLEDREHGASGVLNAGGC